MCLVERSRRKVQGKASEEADHHLFKLTLFG